MHTKTGMLFGQHFDSEPPRNLNHVFLRQFESSFNKKIRMFMFKNQNDGATLSGSGGEPVICGARLTIDQGPLENICDRQFWPGRSYARPWVFRDRETSREIPMPSNPSPAR